MILSTSGTDFGPKQAEKTAFVYFQISLFCILFGAVYEYFSHDVYSYHMLYAFVIPLVGGTLLFWRMARRSVRHMPRPLSRKLYHSGIASLTVGTIFQGVLEIYGTTNQLIRFYYFAGTAFIVLSILFHFLHQFKKNC